MKKTVSIILSVLILAGICIFPVYAQDESAPMFRDEFYKFASWKGAPDYEDVLSYSELAYHNDESGELSWVLVKGETYYVMSEYCYVVIGNRVFRDNSLYAPFQLKYGVYLVKENKFIDVMYVKDYKAYPELENYNIYDDVLADFERLNLGELIGDLNKDGRVDVDDVTELQRCLAEFSDFPANDGIYDGIQYIRYLSDVDGDGVRSIDDVTAIQRALAQLK